MGRVIVFLFLIAFGVGTGCWRSSSGPALPTFSETAEQVTGVVKLDGTPLPGATVTFMFEGSPPKGFIGSGGITDSNGKYQARSGDKLGMPAGRYRVVVQRWATLDGKPFKEDPQAGMDLEQAKMGGTVKEMVPAKYSDPEQTQLTVEITKGQKDPVDFNLATK